MAVRYGMRKDFGSKLPLYATLVAVPAVPVGLALILEWKGWSLAFIAAFIAASALAAEYMYGRLNYVMLHPSHFDIGKWTWGASEPLDRIKESVPYPLSCEYSRESSRVRSSRCASLRFTRPDQTDSCRVLAERLAIADRRTGAARAPGEALP